MSDIHHSLDLFPHVGPVDIGQGLSGDGSSGLPLGFGFASHCLCHLLLSKR